MTFPGEAYKPVLLSVGRHIPPSQMEARCGIMLLRDKANLRLKAAEPQAAELLATIERLGILNALSTMTDEQANKVYCVMAWMMGMASDLQVVFKQDDVAFSGEMG